MINMRRNERILIIIRVFAIQEPRFFDKIPGGIEDAKG
jgi:hypothetical protein